jgi:tetratricopeptide (TPR) repeat protein
MPLPEIPIRSFDDAAAEDAGLRFAVRTAHNAAHPALTSNESPSHDALHAHRRREHVEVHGEFLTNESLTGAASLVTDCVTLYRDLRFDEGITRARRDPGWESDPDARLHVAIGLHYKQFYDEARAEYAVAASVSPSPSFQATCVANIGAAWYEQGDFDRALASFEQSLAVDPLNEFGLMGAVAIAAERRDADEVVRLAARVRERWPAWQERTVIVQLLTTDRSYRFLRKTPGLFERAFGVTLDALLAG